jgi:hypothetical protein
MSASISAMSMASTSQASVSSSLTALSPEERMLALVVYSQASQMNEARTSIDLNAEQLERLREQVRKALDEAREAKKDAGFWGGLAKIFGSDLASIASAVAALAAVVATGGTAAAILAVVAATASFAADHAKELGLPESVAMAIALAASAAALCCGDAKGLFKVSAQVAKTANDFKTCATAAAITFKAGGAACSAGEAVYERDAAYFQADAQQADGLQDLASADMDAAIDRLSTALERQNSAIEILSSTQQQAMASSFAVLGNWRTT